MIELNRWDEIKQIVQAALDRPQEERAGYIVEACGGDETLQRDVDTLLAIPETNVRFVDNLEVLPPTLRRAHLAQGEMAGPYRIISQLGEGGMGVVYLAQDTRVDRKVALKIGPQRLAQEQYFLARLDHRYIATFYDCGSTQSGFGYFAMEYVDGTPLDVYCEANGLSIHERLALFLQVCEAVAFAHRKLVAHRDIKPSNILVADDGNPRLLDFGNAKNLISSAHSLTLTRPEDRALTVAFASPEQLAGERTDTTTDIYSLGVLLCLLLTRRLPYAVKSYHDLPWAIRNMEPEKPSRLVQAPPLPHDAEPPTLGKENASGSRKLAHMLAGDLDAIVLRALRKESGARYRTVEELAEDINNYLNHTPVTARKGDTSYTLGKFVKRHNVAVPVTAVVMLAFLGLVFSSYHQGRSRDRLRQNHSLPLRRYDELRLKLHARTPKGIDLLPPVSHPC